MNKCKNLLLPLILVISSSISLAQRDTIVKKTNEKIPCLIQTVDDEKELITYKVMTGEDVPILSIKYERVDRLIFRNGQSIVYNSEKVVQEATETFIGKHKQAVRVGVFNSIYGGLDLSYERNINPLLNLEGTIGIISDHFDLRATNGYNQREHQHGAYMRLKAKLFFKGMGDPNDQRNHPLSGAYVAPELAASIYRYSGGRYYQYFDPYGYSYYGYEKQWIENASLAFLTNIGFEKTFLDIFTLDMFIGLGLAVDDLEYVDNGNIRYSHFNGGGLAYNFGMNLGIAF